MSAPAWDQRLARVLVRRLAPWPAVGPNRITTLSLLPALGAGGLYATGDGVAASWATVAFVLARCSITPTASWRGSPGRRRASVTTTITWWVR